MEQLFPANVAQRTGARPEGFLYRAEVVPRGASLPHERIAKISADGGTSVTASTGEMRVALTSPRYRPDHGGVETLVQQLAKGLVARGAAVEVLTMSRAGRPAIEEIDGVLVRRFRTLAADSPCPVALGLGYWLSRNADRFDVIHGFSYHALPALQSAFVSRRSGVPLVLSLVFHGTGHSPLRRMLHVPYRIAGGWMIDHAERVVCLSAAEEAEVRASFGEHIPSVVVPGGIDTSAAQPIPGLQRKRGSVLTVSRLDGYKRVDQVVRAVAHLDAAYSLSVVGCGSARASIERTAATFGVSDRIRMLGRTSGEELQAAYQSADVFVTLSTRESFGLTVLEAGHAGAKVLASDIPAHREIARYLPEGAVTLVGLDATPTEIAAAIDRLSRSEERPSGPSQPPTWDEMAEGTWQLYREILQQGEVPRSFRGRGTGRRGALRGPAGHASGDSPAMSRSTVRGGSSSMCILMLTDFYPPIIGGMELHVQRLARALHARGHHVAIATTAPDGVPSETEEDGITVYRLRGSVQRATSLVSHSGHPFSPPIPDPEMLWGIRQVIKRENPQIVHAHNWMVHSYGPLKSWSRARLVMTLHDYSFACSKKTLMTAVGPCDGPALRKCLDCGIAHYGLRRGVPTVFGLRVSNGIERSAVDMFLPVSRAVAEGSGLRTSSLPYRIIPNFVLDDVAENRSIPESVPGLPERYLLFVGALTHTKGVGVLLRAHAMIPQAPPLVLIGPGKTEPELELPASGVMVLLALPNSAVMRAWKGSIAGVVPSVWPEPCPTVAMEAMSAGRPLVASRIGGLPDIIIDGETGLLVRPGDAEALRDALVRLLRDDKLRERMGASALRRVSRFQAADVVPQIEAVYADVLRERLAG